MGEESGQLDVQFASPEEKDDFCKDLRAVQGHMQLKTDADALKTLVAYYKEQEEIVGDDDDQSAPSNFVSAYLNFKAASAAAGKHLKNSVREIPFSITQMSPDELQKELREFDGVPENILENRKAHEAYLVWLKAGREHKFCYELEIVLEGLLPVPDLSQLENDKVQKFFRSSSCLQKTSYTYLLLDPTQLPEGRRNFRTFVEAVFYVGKGTGLRIYEHIKKPQTHRMKKRITKLTTEGVIHLQLFHCTTNEEAYFREACLLDALYTNPDTTNLVNGQRGHNISKYCTDEQKHVLGVYFLFKAYLIYYLDHSQPITKDNVKETT